MMMQKIQKFKTNILYLSSGVIRSFLYGLLPAFLISSLFTLVYFSNFSVFFSTRLKLFAALFFSLSLELYPLIVMIAYLIYKNSHVIKDYENFLIVHGSRIGKKILTPFILFTFILGFLMAFTSLYTGKSLENNIPNAETIRSISKKISKSPNQWHDIMGISVFHTKSLSQIESKSENLFMENLTLIKRAPIEDGYHISMLINCSRVVLHFDKINLDSCSIHNFFHRDSSRITSLKK